MKVFRRIAGVSLIIKLTDIWRQQQPHDTQPAAGKKRKKMKCAKLCVIDGWCFVSHHWVNCVCVFHLNSAESVLCLLGFTCSSNTRKNCWMSGTLRSKHFFSYIYLSLQPMIPHGLSNFQPRDLFLLQFYFFVSDSFTFFSLSFAVFFLKICSFSVFAVMKSSMSNR